MQEIGIVVIGRNEGIRLRRCIASVTHSGAPIVYVDSGSIDGSAELARSLRATVVLLDPSRPYSAARARNEGLKILLHSFPAVRFVQFVDGDCEIAEDWISHAADFLEACPEVSAVCGRLRELHPGASIYNRLCDMEWNGPVGQIKTCPGIAMYRVVHFKAVGGFNSTVVAGEEADLCCRIRRRGWVVLRLSQEMAFHDADMRCFRQWWTRSVRSGYAYAQVAALHWRASDRQNLRELLSIVLWSVVNPVLSIALMWHSKALSLMIVLGYALLWLRIRNHRLNKGDSPGSAMLYANFCVLAKFAQIAGVIRFLWHIVLRRPAQILEYKQATVLPRRPRNERARPGGLRLS